MQEKFCELCGSLSYLSVTIGTPLGIVRGDICFECFDNGERDEEVVWELMMKRYAEVQGLWGLEHEISEDHPVPLNIAEEIFQFVLDGETDRG